VPEKVGVAQESGGDILVGHVSPGALYLYELGHHRLQVPLDIN
jgi:hypothetical protein